MILWILGKPTSRLFLLKSLHCNLNNLLPKVKTIDSVCSVFANNNYVCRWPMRCIDYLLTLIFKAMLGVTIALRGMNQ